MPLRDEINDALKTAMKAGDKIRVSTLRLMNAAIKERTAGRDAGASDQQLIEVFAKMVKQRQESLAAYEQAGREDLASQERKEMEIIQGYMPRQLSDEDVRREIDKLVKDTGAAGMKDMGKVMAALKERYAGQVDMAKAGAIVKSLLGK
jgi:uncharacterized protein YqeY